MRQISNKIFDQFQSLDEFVWFSHQQEPDNLLFSLSDNKTIDSDHLQKSHCLLLMKQEIGVIHKYSDIKISKVKQDLLEQNIIWTGCVNGAIGLYDLRTENSQQEFRTRLSNTTNYLPIVNLHQINNVILSVGQEGRICQYDSRQLQSPVQFKDIFLA